MRVLDRIQTMIQIFNPPRRAPRPENPPGISDEDLYQIMARGGLIYSKQGYTDEEARAELEWILSSQTPEALKYDALHALDVKVQNWTERGMASPVISEILSEQYKLIKKMEEE